MNLVSKHNVKVSGRGTTPIVFAHGFGCDQNMWRLLTPAFEDNYKIVCFDYIGHGKAINAFYDRTKYGSLDGYADDLIAICRELQLKDVVFVGHSVSATIGILASVKEPDLFSKLILVSPSPRFINDAGYVGGFARADIDELLEFLDSNHLGWSSAMAPTIMGTPERPELEMELANSFCQTDPEVAKQFARVTFLADNRSDLPKISRPTLILQCAKDAIAPVDVGKYMQLHIAESELVVLEATGHCPHLSSPTTTADAIKKYLEAV